MIDSVMKSVKAEQEKEASLKEKENELRKLKEENAKLAKDKHNGRQQFHTLVENLVRSHAPQLITEEFSDNGKKLIAEDTDQWINHVSPAMIACNMSLIEQKSKQQEQWVKKLEALNNFVNNGQDTVMVPNMVQANYHKVSGGKRSSQEMMNNGSSSMSTNTAGAASFLDRIPMSAQSRELFSQWGKVDYGMEVRPMDLGFDAKRLAAKDTM
jgi:hypothetical protein